MLRWRHMDLKDVTKDMVDRENWRIQRQLDDLIRHNPRYKHLDDGDKQVIIKLITKYKEKLRKGIRPSLTTVREDKYYLYENRFKLGLTPEDLNQINKLLDSFKS